MLRLEVSGKVQSPHHVCCDPADRQRFARLTQAAKSRLHTLAQMCNRDAWTNCIALGMCDPCINMRECLQVIGSALTATSTTTPHAPSASRVASPSESSNDSCLSSPHANVHIALSTCRMSQP